MNNRNKVFGKGTLTAKEEGETLLLRDERYRTLIQTAMDGFCLMDLQGFILEVNASYCQMSGYSEQELLTMNVNELESNETVKETAAHIQQVKLQGEDRFTSQHRRKNGELFDVEVSVQYRPTNGGQFICFLRDITEHIQTEKKLITSRGMLAETESLGKVGGWEFNIDTGQQTWTKGVYDIHEADYGYDPTLSKGLDFYTQDSKPIITEAVKQAVAQGEPFDVELEIQTAKGNVRSVHAIGRADLENRRVHGFFQDITERKELEEKYRRLAKLTSDYVHYCTRTGDSAFKVQWVDGAINAISGYHVNDILTFGCFLPLVHPEDRQNVSDYLFSLAPGDHKEIEFRIMTQQKEIRWVSEKSQCEAGQTEGELILLGAVTDITEQKQATEALQKSQEMLAQTQRLAKIGSWQHEISSNQLAWSDETYRIFGREPQTFVATYEAFLDAVHPDDRAIVDAAYSASLREGQAAYEIEHRIIRKDSGEVRHVYEKCRHERNAGGAVIRSIGMVQDITELKSNEVALLAATQATESANRAKGLFLAKVSHEIRTPMTAIIGFGELLEDADLIPEHKRYLEAINTSGSALSSLIEDVLDLSKVDAGELAVKPRQFSLHKLITKLVSTQEGQIARKNLSSNISIDNDVPDSLIGDPQRIQQVLLNLLGNAIKFTEKGEVGIAVSVAEENNIRVLLDIAVQDTGIGISADLHGQIFEPFTQALGSSPHRYGGSGLGLTISRSLAGLMGGTIRLESRESVGSTFHLLIPLQRNNDNLAENPLPEREPLLWKGPVLSILLAEDNPVNSQFIKAVLEHMGHAVAVAKDGKAALDLLKASTFDLALMDIQMPLLNGDDVLSVIRELEQLSGKHLTVIALTAYALIGDREKYLNMGFDGYLSKPFKTKELVNEMVRVLSC